MLWTSVYYNIWIRYDKLSHTHMFTCQLFYGNVHACACVRVRAYSGVVLTTIDGYNTS